MYTILFGLGIIIVEEHLKWLGQCPRLMHISNVDYVGEVIVLFKNDFEMSLY